MFIAVWVCKAASAEEAAGGFLLQRYFAGRTQWDAEVGRSFKSTCCMRLWAWLRCTCAGEVQSGRFREVSCFSEHRASLRRAEHGHRFYMGMGRVSTVLSKHCQHL